jgi:hypothetical protein
VPAPGFEGTIDRATLNSAFTKLVGSNKISIPEFSPQAVDTAALEAGALQAKSLLSSGALGRLSSGLSGELGGLSSGLNVANAGSGMVFPTLKI